MSHAFSSPFGVDLRPADAALWIRVVPEKCHLGSTAVTEPCFPRPIFLHCPAAVRPCWRLAFDSHLRLRLKSELQNKKNILDVGRCFSRHGCALRLGLEDTP
jgi:hypothetical protein